MALVPVVFAIAVQNHRVNGRRRNVMRQGCVNNEDDYTAGKRTNTLSTKSSLLNHRRKTNAPTTIKNYCK